MKLTIVNSNSAGNAYILEGQEEALLIECGCNMNKIRQAIKFQIKKFVGCLITHEHNDHCSDFGEVIRSGINIFTSRGTTKALKARIDEAYHHRLNPVAQMEEFYIGGFKIFPFPVKHDAAEPLGFLIFHPAMGTTLFLTDTYYCGYKFDNLNNIIIEANYSDERIDAMMLAAGNRFVRNRVIGSHMSIETCMEFLLANNLTEVNNIVLIHLSDNNSHESNFIEQIQGLTGKTVWAAKAGMVINDFGKQPY